MYKEAFTSLSRINAIILCTRPQCFILGVFIKLLFHQVREPLRVEISRVSRPRGQQQNIRREFKCVDAFHAFLHFRGLCLMRKDIVYEEPRLFRGHKDKLRIMLSTEVSFHTPVTRCSCGHSAAIYPP